MCVACDVMTLCSQLSWLQAPLQLHAHQLLYYTSPPTLITSVLLTSCFAHSKTFSHERHSFRVVSFFVLNVVSRYFPAWYIRRVSRHVVWCLKKLSQTQKILPLSLSNGFASFCIVLFDFVSARGSIKFLVTCETRQGYSPPNPHQNKWSKQKRFFFSLSSWFTCPLPFTAP